MRTLLQFVFVLLFLPMNIRAGDNPIEQALSESLDSDLKAFFSTAALPTEPELREFERFIGYSLPDEFRELHKTKFGSFYVEAKESVWPRHKEGDVGPFWSFLYGFYVYTLSSDAPEWMSLRRATEEFRELSKTDLTPFLKVVGDADVYCFDRRGRIVRWDHETANARQVDQSFVEVVRAELRSLAERKNRKKSGKQ